MFLTWNFVWASDKMTEKRMSLPKVASVWRWEVQYVELYSDERLNPFGNLGQLLQGSNWKKAADAATTLIK